MSEMEEDVMKLINGRGSSLPISVDFAEKSDSSFQPVIKTNVCYIVACVVISENDEVLMMQEAKQSCYGKWYLPAGRVEKNESLIDAAKREMKEETGLEFEPETLVYVEFQQSFWYRFTFTGKIVGGDLKTPDQEDKESIQAKWWPTENIDTNPDLSLRSLDILLPIKKVKQYINREDQLVMGINITRKPYNNMYVRLLLCQYFEDMHIVKIVTAGKSNKHLPTTIATCRKPFSQQIGKLLSLIFKDMVSAYPKVLGILSFEHDGSTEPALDGFCFTILISVGNNTNTGLELQKKFSWLDVRNGTLVNCLQKRLVPDSLSLCGMKLSF